MYVTIKSTEWLVNFTCALYTRPQMNHRFLFFTARLPGLFKISLVGTKTNFSCLIILIVNGMRPFRKTMNGSGT